MKVQRPGSPTSSSESSSLSSHINYLALIDEYRINSDFTIQERARSLNPGGCRDLSVHRYLGSVQDVPVSGHYAPRPWPRPYSNKKRKGFYALRARTLGNFIYYL